MPHMYRCKDCGATLLYSSKHLNCPLSDKATRLPRFIAADDVTRREKALGANKPHIMFGANGWQVYAARTFNLRPSGYVLTNAARFWAERRNHEALAKILYR